MEELHCLPTKRGLHFQPIGHPQHPTWSSSSFSSLLLAGRQTRHPGHPPKPPQLEWGSQLLVQHLPEVATGYLQRRRIQGRDPPCCFSF